MDPLVTGSLISGGAQVANGLIEQVFAEHNRERNFYWNEKAADSADQRQRAQYMDLYAPKAQLEQYQAAGLSPSMMMSGGQSAVGQSSAQGNMSAGIQGPYPSGIKLDPMTAAQIANINADTKLKDSQRNNTDKDTELKGQEIINLVSEEKNIRAKHRLITAQTDLTDLEFSTNLQTAQATISQACSNAEKAAAETRSAIVQADLDEATFDVAYQMAYANLDNTLTDTALAKSEIGVNKAQIKEITERIRNSQWQTWATEKEQNRKDAIFKFDQAKFKTEVEKWAQEMNIELTGMKLDMVSDLVGYVCNFAQCGLSNATEIKKTDMYTKSKEKINKEKLDKQEVEYETIVSPDRKITTKSKTKRKI